MKWAWMFDFVVLVIWGALYCAEELRRAGKQWDTAKFLVAVKHHMRAKIVKTPSGTYIVHAASAEVWAANALNELRESGWMETGPGVWTSPDGKSTVML